MNAENYINKQKRLSRIKQKEIEELQKNMPEDYKKIVNIVKEPLIADSVKIKLWLGFLSKYKNDNLKTLNDDDLIAQAQKKMRKFAGFIESDPLPKMKFAFIPDEELRRETQKNHTTELEDTVMRLQDPGQIEIMLKILSNDGTQNNWKGVMFKHRDHQRKLLAQFSGDKEKACGWCHHKKRKGRDPKKCSLCHTDRVAKSKGGVDFPFLKNLNLLRPEQLLREKDCFHAVCNGCHFYELEKDLELATQDKRVPVSCDDCHVSR